jgi:hypothetical protein
MNYWRQLFENTSVADKALSQDERLQLEELEDMIEAAKADLYGRMRLYIDVYLTPTQARRWYLYFTTGSIRNVAEAEGVSTAAVSKSLIGTRPNESSGSRIKSPVAKLQKIVLADVEVQSLLLRIRTASDAINEIKEGY